MHRRQAGVGEPGHPHVLPTILEAWAAEFGGQSPWPSGSVPGVRPPPIRHEEDHGDTSSAPCLAELLLAAPAYAGAPPPVGQLGIRCLPLKAKGVPSSSSEECGGCCPAGLARDGCLTERSASLPEENWDPVVLGWG